ncbi:RagB/SusD family nutrient uptake outer membrane protein [Fibrivirga algicola]|uniref:RagB/SusD family nutrient uptake outer membrane protein n=1 Tax=Fibrivirga algicola TaxID=2950420 RepID=A0ABX0QNB3_9BACT|nr:RagB/SusD family nutrient uptake outer membrane protein [Fibrivirga algicola]NID12093.1 RagB/SusD family nutrient uptake outer membrane protein [Fibrivirga algicola]
MKRYLPALFAASLSLMGCADLLEPEVENLPGKEAMYKEVTFAQGFLLNGYTRLPGLSFNDVATDDAVSNDKNNAYQKVATGQWTANFNPADQWVNSTAAIQYLNTMLSEVDKVTWATDPKAAQMFRDRIKGEAYGLRAFYMFQLLRAHGGWSNSGELLGVPILTQPQDTKSDFNQPRATFEACMQQFYSDIKQAEELLPLDYEDVSTQAQVPTKYVGVTPEEYTRVFGQYSRLRMTARIAKAIRAQAALFAASPAYKSGTTTTWADAANYAGEVLKLIGGPARLAANGVTWYDNRAEINSLGAGINPPEILWRSDASNSRNLEEDNYPPSLFGRGRINPTQNLVDAFPMANGYPIGSPASGYNAQAPYAGRDPRLQRYIVTNGSTLGPSNTVVRTETGSGNDAVNQIETSTRTGYYMRKLLRADVNLNPIGINDQRHYTTRIRYTEIFLAYAEAANEAWGPDAAGTVGFSARDVIRAIRQRAGIGTTNGDAYLNTVQTQADMRQLIRNERRLELCFEGFRFWDLRRWSEKLTETANGIQITAGNYVVIPVENRAYAAHMNHGPIPYGELLKWKSLVQNKGW